MGGENHLQHVGRIGRAGSSAEGSCDTTPNVAGQVEAMGGDPESLAQPEHALHHCIRSCGAAKAALAMARPWTPRRPRRSAKLRRLTTMPAARRKLDPKRVTVSPHAFGLAPIR